MVAPVRAVVLLQPNERGLITPMQRLERTMIIDNWEYAKQYKGTTGFYSGKWNHYQAGIRNNSNYGIRYTSGNAYRNESVIVKTSRKTSGKNVVSSADGGSGEATDANGNQWYEKNEVDSINIDFRAEVKGKFKSDWDLGYAFPESGHSYQFTENGSWSATDGADKRILFNAEFDEAFPKRPSVSGTDPLWVRIESDPIKNPYTGAGVSNFNSVRQITLNFSSDNTKTGNDGNYTHRPYVIFYTGPENIDYTTDSNGVLIRHSQPVVINLNANLNAIIYMPNSPVIINGNDNKLSGFVIAKCFLLSVTEEDMTNGDFFEHYDGFNASEIIRGNFSKGISKSADDSENTVYFHSDNLFTKTEIDNLYAGREITPLEDGTTGNLTIKEKIKAPEYLWLDYSKSDHDKYAVTENGQINENKTFGAYVNATYKEKFKTCSGLSDSEISAVNFPDENYNETTATYYVKSTDVSSTAVDANYVKVLVGGETKYVDKRKLPYVKVRTNNEYFYVCVSDLQLLKDLNGKENRNKGVRMVDTTDGDKDIYVNPADQYGDSWKIDRTRYNNKEYDNWKKDKLQFIDGTSYFIRTAEIVNEPQVIAKYHKIVVEEETGVETVKYIREDDSNVQYYTKVYNNANNHDNYIIVDKNGNILTKTLTPPEVFNVDDVDSNNALEKKINSLFGKATDKDLRDYYNVYTREPNSDEQPGDPGKIVDGRYVYNDVNHENLDYQIPALERVYKKSTFNLKEYDSSKGEKYDISDDSFYSYFGIKDLYRVNYTYLNRNELEYSEGKKYPSADMFFTEKRAEWID